MHVLLLFFMVLKEFQISYLKRKEYDIVGKMVK